MNIIHQQIEKDVVDLQESMHILYDLVNGQQDHLDTIEDMIHHTKEESEKVVTDLVVAVEIQQTTNYMKYIMGGIATLILYILI